jgi:anti-anti-sigma regulatory factor
MQSDDVRVSRRVTVHDLDRVCAITVEGDLDLIGGYDLRNAVAAALHRSSGAVALDLSSVTAVDDRGLASLEWCSAQAVEARRVLTWSACSHPLIRALEHRLAAPRQAPRME